MSSCKLPKVVTDAAIPRKVRAVCELVGGNKHFFVRGDDGKPGRIFSKGGAFARHIKANYSARLGNSGTSSFVEARTVRDQIEAEIKRWKTILDQFPRSAVGLPSDAVRLSPAYQTAKRAIDDEIARLRKFNSVFTKKFARELAEERNRRRSKTL